MAKPATTPISELFSQLISHLNKPAEAIGQTARTTGQRLGNIPSLLVPSLRESFLNRQRAAGFGLTSSPPSQPMSVPLGPAGRNVMQNTLGGPGAVAAMTGRPAAYQNLGGYPELGMGMGGGVAGAREGVQTGQSMPLDRWATPSPGLTPQGSTSIYGDPKDLPRTGEALLQAILPLLMKDDQIRPPVTAGGAGSDVVLPVIPKDGSTKPPTAEKPVTAGGGFAYPESLRSDLYENSFLSGMSDWVNAFQEEHEGQGPIEFYGGGWGDEERDKYAANSALWDRSWAEQFQRTYGKPPAEGDWQASYWDRQSMQAQNSAPAGGPWQGYSG